MRSFRLRLLAVTAVIIIAASVIISYALDPFVRVRIEHALNRNLKGYHADLRHAHVSIWGLALALRDLTLIQDAHPSPPVGHIPLLRISIEWLRLLEGHVVADCLLADPTFNINLTQLKSEAASKVPLRQSGWQDALQSIYPFKIDRFAIRRADITYIDTDPKRPLYLQQLSLTASNIRNINSPRDPYPSSIEAHARVFGSGRVAINGQANFLTKPTPAMRISYRLEQVPLAALEPAIKRVNLTLTGGQLDSEGTVEYSPKIERVEVRRAAANDVHIEYTHQSATAAAEERRVEEIRKAAARANNAPDLLLQVDSAQLTNCILGYRDEAGESPYRLYISDLNLHATDISNQSSQGNSVLGLDGLFMGSGKTKMTGDFHPRKSSPDFDINLTIVDTQLPSMNDLLRRYGRFDVQSGQFSLYAQITAKDNQITGHIKPFFANLEVYSRSKDKNKPLMHQAYELTVGGAAKLLRNHSTQAVATNVDLSGKLQNPDVSTLRALAELARNAFINAIVPGFDRQVKAAGGQSS